MSLAARDTAEAVARASYGRLVAYLASRSQDIAAAEDALGEAFRAALETWPRDGVPAVPEAWLLTTARRRLMDGARRAQVRSAAASTLKLLAEETAEPMEFPDERLKLLFVCAHPAIDAGSRTPLMLQTVLGLDAVRIASAFLVAPGAMGQRLVRAKAKIRDAGVSFRVPEPAELPERLECVLEAIYAAYGSGWDDLASADPRRSELAEEAIWLAGLVTDLLPREPEALGLLALVLHCEARRAARRGRSGAYVPLDAQDTALWSRELIGQAEAALSRASSFGRIGRFQLEAAIQSVHAQRATTGRTEWPAIITLYGGLLRQAPTLGACIGHAAALAQAEGPVAGLTALDAIDADAASNYQPYWAARAHLLAALGERKAAQAAYARAIGLSEDATVRAFLQARLRRA